MKIGYARVSTDEQNLDLQLDALKAAGCEKIFMDQGISGITRERAGLSEALGAIGKEDILIVWKLDRLGRSLGFLCELIEGLKEQGIGFQSLTDGIDTTTNGGKLVFHIMGALAEFERDLIRERTKAGMKAAKKRGKHVGRPKSLSNGQVQHMHELLDAGKTQAEVAELFGVSANTIGRKVREKRNRATDDKETRISKEKGSFRGT
jgi:DNA invertase Pin-like site-specific DNA recombinase